MRYEYLEGDLAAVGPIEELWGTSGGTDEGSCQVGYGGVIADRPVAQMTRELTIEV